VSDLSALDRFLQTDPRDVGCEQVLELLHVYVELVVAAGAASAGRYPGIVAHLRACGPCAEDFDGLMAAIAGAASEQEAVPLKAAPREA
jgi:hypothetical protein